jgi:peptidyl-prolyl cis-trans isomerase SurA
MQFRLIIVLSAALTMSVLSFSHVSAQDQKVLVTVNDTPITSYDVDQRINLWKLLGISRGEGARKRALNELIDDIAKINEAKKLRLDPTEKEIDVRLAEVATGLKTNPEGLKAKLKAQGITVAAMRTYFTAQIAFGRILKGKYNVSVKATPEEIDRKLNGYKSEINGKLAKVMADPRMRPITVYQVQEINFPIDGGESGMTNELIQSRAIEANAYLSKFRGCKSARAAAAGIFNVKVGKMVEADGARLPKPLKAALDKTKVGRAIGPSRTPDGLQVLAFCGVRKIVPPKPQVTYPTRQQAENAVLNEKYERVVSKYSSQFRKDLLIEYRDPSYGP